MARLRGVERRAVRGRVDEVVEQFALEEYYNVLLAKLSKGSRQRVGLAQSIIHDPEVLILDEPTIGIDPIQVAQTRQLIRELGENRTILLSSHILPEVSMVRERVIIIHQGRIVAEDSIENLFSMVSGTERLRLRVNGPADAVSAALDAVAGVVGVHFREPDHLVEFAAGEQPHGEITAIVARGWTLTGTFFTTYLAGGGYADTSIRGFVNAARFLVLLFAAVLTMRLVSEEKKVGTWELLLTVPVRDVEIVVGKFLEALAMLSAMLVLTLYYPIMLLAFGDPDTRGVVYYVTVALLFLYLSVRSIEVGKWR